jgi:antitoxin MazE
MSVATSKVQKWGNSLGVRIAKHVAEAAGVHEGSEVELRVEDGTIVVAPAMPTEFRLDELLTGVTRKNVHAEIGAIGPEGKKA